MEFLSHFIKMIEEYRYLTLSMGHGDFGATLHLLKVLEAWGLTNFQTVRFSGEILTINFHSCPYLLGGGGGG